MQPKHFKTNWLMSGFALVLAAGTVGANLAYWDCQERIQAHEKLNAVVDRIYIDQQVSSVLKQMRNGEAEPASQRLDGVLCGDILRLDAELGALDDHTRQFVLASFERMARVRPRVSEFPAQGVSANYTQDQLSAQKILSLAARATTGSQ